MGLQISRDIHPEVSAQDVVRRVAQASWRNVSQSIFGTLMRNGEFRRLAMEFLLHKVYGTWKTGKGLSSSELMFVLDHKDDLQSYSVR